MKANSIKAILHSILFSLLLLPILAFGQGGVWTWMKGTGSLSPAGVYGTPGVASPNNSPTGTYEAANWIDQQGNLWIFGGVDPNQRELSDLWKFDPVANMWTYIRGPQGVIDKRGVYGTKGIASPLNTPGARGWGVICWTDLAGNFWLFGGTGWDAAGNFGALNDLWRYETSTNKWTWVSGSNLIDQPDHYGVQGVAANSNCPGSRQEDNSAWVDANGDLWFFGGENGANQPYNDMWRYNIETNQWTWMSGPQGTYKQGNYGVMGVESPTNLPPPRATYTRWKDASGNFYIFGGVTDSIDLTTNTTYGLGSAYSDVWRYNPGNNEWTWVAGDSTRNSNGNYQSYCTYSGSTGPHSRYENRTAQVLGCTNMFLTLGGVNSEDGYDYAFQDLWLFNSVTNQWKWLNGYDASNVGGNFGTQGIPSPGNSPPAIAGQCQWVDNLGRLWFFGGLSGDFVYKYADVWMYTPDNTCTPEVLSAGLWYQLSSSSICRRDSVQLTLNGNITPLIVSPSAGVTISDSSQAWLKPDTTTTYTVSAQTTCGYDTVYVTVHVNNPASGDFTISSNNICLGDSALVQLYGMTGATITPSSSVIWTDTFNTFAILVPAATTVYHISGYSLTCGTYESVTDTVVVNTHPPVTYALSDTVPCRGDSVHLSVTGLTSAYLNPANYVSWIDANNAWLKPVNSQAFVLSGFTTCGFYSTGFNIHVAEPGVVPYLISDSSLCAGDSAFVTLLNLANAHISPATGVTWVDSAHLILKPTVNTQYTITGNSSCGTRDSSVINIYIQRPGTFNYYLSDSDICLGTTVYLGIVGLSGIQISPQSGLYPSDSAHFAVYPDTTTTYVITGLTACGYMDTGRVTIRMTGSYVLSSVDRCGGDSVYLHTTDLRNVTLTPTTYVHWIDSNTAVLFPPTATFFNFSATNSCGQYIYDNFYMNVFSYSNLYFIQDTELCAGSSCYLYLSNDLDSSNVRPHTGITWIESTTGLVNPDTSTAYTISGLPCNPASETFTVHRKHSNDETWQADTVICSTTQDSYYQTIYFHDMTVYQVKPSGTILSDSVCRVTLAPGVNTFTVIGSSRTCSYEDTAVIHFYYYEPGQVSTFLSDSLICLGSSATLFIPGVTNASISPSTGVHWQDSSHIIFSPTTTTTYRFIAATACSAHDTSYFTIHVEHPGVADFTITDTNLCLYQGAFIYVTGLAGASIQPSNLVSWQDTAYAYLRLPTDSQTFTLTGLSNVCGTRDTAKFTLRIQNGFSLSSTSICAGDTSFFSFFGYDTMQITPANLVTWKDAHHALLIPDSTTSFRFHTVDTCGDVSSMYYQIIVSHPGQLTYTIGDTAICLGQSVDFYTPGLTSGSISPTTGVSYNGGASGVIIPDTTTTYTLTGQNACGGVSAHFTIHVTQYNPISYHLSDSTVCGSDTTILTVTGLHGVYFSNYSYNFAEIDSQHFALFPGNTEDYVVYGYTSCGNLYQFNAIVNVIRPNSISANLAYTTVCRGDSGYLMINGLSPVSITPSASVSWIDSMTAWLFPDTTTTYTVSGQNSCGGIYSHPITLTVTQPNVLNYTLLDSVVYCTGAYNFITFNSNIVSNPMLIPSTGVTWYDGTAEFEADSTTHYMFIGTICGQVDTATFTVRLANDSQLLYRFTDSVICLGDTTSIQLTGNAGGVQFHPTAGVINTYTNGLYNLAPDTSTTYMLTTYLCNQRDTNYFRVTVLNAQPVSFNLNDTLICAGDSAILTLTNISSASVSPAVSVHWIDSLHAILNPATSTSYTVTGYNSCGGRYSHSFNVHVQPLQAVNYNLSPPVICQSDSSQLTINGLSNITLSPALNVAWINTTQAWLYPVATTTYTVRGLNSCSRPNSLSVSVTINNPVTPSVQLSARVCCPGKHVVVSTTGLLNVTILPGANITWVDSAHAWLSPQAYTVYTLSGINSCGKIYTDTFSANVYTVAPVQITGDTAICQGDSVQLCATTGFVVYNWSNAQSTPCFYTSHAGSYIVTATDNNGCTDTSGAHSLMVVPKSAVAITPNPTGVCPGDSAQLCATSGFSSYMWNTGLSTSCIFVRASGSYTVTATDNFNCTVASLAAHVSAYAQPTGAITRNNDTLKTTGGISYQWYFNGAIIHGANAYYYVATNAGSYNVAITDSDGCTALLTPVEITGIATLESDGISVYPNPNTTGSYFLSVDEHLVGSEVDVFDAEGKIIYKSRIETPVSQILVEAAGGVYLLRIISGDRSIVRKLVKL